MWQVDGLDRMLATAAEPGLEPEQARRGSGDLLPAASSTSSTWTTPTPASSVLMPQKRNPYALAIVRGASGVLIGRLSGFLAVTKSPSARSDNLIFAYGEVPRALDLAQRMTRADDRGGAHPAGQPGPDARASSTGLHARRPTWPSTSVQGCGVDYRTAYLVVGDVGAGRPSGRRWARPHRGDDQPGRVRAPAPAGHCSTPTFRQCWTRPRSWPPGRSGRCRSPPSSRCCTRPPPTPPPSRRQRARGFAAAEEDLVRRVRLSSVV